MAATGNEAVTLAQLKAFSDSIPSGGGGTDLKFEMVQILNPTLDEWISTPGGSCQYKFVNFQPLAFSFACIYVPGVFEFISTGFLNYNNKPAKPGIYFESDSAKPFMAIDRDTAWQTSALEPIQGFVNTSFKIDGDTTDYCGYVVFDQINSTVGGDFQISAIFTKLGEYFRFTPEKIYNVSITGYFNSITIPFNRFAYLKS